MKDTDKVTLTVEQIKKLIAESKKAPKAKVNEDLNAWKKADRALNSTKREIAQKGKELYKQLVNKFITTMSKDFVRNNISLHSDRPQDAAEQLLDSFMNGDSLSAIVHEMYLFDDGTYDD